MKPINTLFLITFLLLSRPARADVWRVGPSQTYKVPSAVASLVKDGDEVWIDPVEYVGDVAVWRANRLKLMVAPPANDRLMAILKADGKAAEQKAIWVIKGNDCVVARIDFRDCVVPDRNGAGIRVEGTNITVSNCAFRKNQDGILAGNNLNSTIIVEGSEFEQSGAGDGLSHAIYINHVKAFIFRYNYSHGTLVGHECKSRAHFNYIAYNRITNEDGTGSRNIDLPNGGTSVIIGNLIHKGANAENGNVIGYGLEGLSDTVDNSLYISHNTVVSDRGLGTLLRTDSKTKLIRAVNNIYVGNLDVLIGGATTIDTTNNFAWKNASNAGLVNAASYDYRLTASSPARNRAVDPGTATSTVKDYTDLPLSPVLEYAHVGDNRIRIAQRDLGAYEFSQLTSVNEPAPPAPFLLYPNPASDLLRIVGEDITTTDPVKIYSISGDLLANSFMRTIDVSRFAPGFYVAECGGHRAMFVIVR
ncbi:MAG: T9SS type A sorting domain-containing protein [Candidatus Kapabacteria bacterium]|nr:T9SS type A sorting domain-containing protein [Candidatus Kapabacteria bacterium]